MITLKIGNSTSSVSGLTVGQFKELKELMSYDIGKEAAHFSGSYHNTKRSLLSKRGEFPTGLLYIFVGWAYSVKLADLTCTDVRSVPKPLEGVFNLSLPFPPYKEQIEAAEAILDAHRGIICAPTGSGKSVIIALVINALKVPTLVVVPTLELKRQLKESLTQFFGREAPIVVQNVDALDPKVELKSIGAVIIDEFHHSAAKTYRKLNERAWKNVYYRVGLTATPFRSNDNEAILLESILAETLYTLPYKKAVEKGYIVPLEAYSQTLPKTKMKGNDKDYRAVYNELIVNNASRNNRIAEMLEALQASGSSTLCLVKEIKHGEILADLTGCPFANGQDGNSAELIRRFNSGEMSVLIGTSGIVGEGCDTKPCEYVILASTGKSKTQFMQQCGRALRVYGDKTSGKVIMFKDPSHKWLIKHYNQCILYLETEYGVKVHELPPM